MELLSIQEFARLKRLPIKTAYRLANDGVLPKIVLNQRTIRIPVEEAEAALASLTQHSLVKGRQSK